MVGIPAIIDFFLDSKLWSRVVYGRWQVKGVIHGTPWDKVTLSGRDYLSDQCLRRRPSRTVATLAFFPTSRGLANCMHARSIGDCDKQTHFETLQIMTQGSLTAETQTKALVISHRCGSILTVHQSSTDGIIVTLILMSRRRALLLFVLKLPVRDRTQVVVDGTEKGSVAMLLRRSPNSGKLPSSSDASASSKQQRATSWSCQRVVGSPWGTNSVGDSTPRLFEEAVRDFRAWNRRSSRTVRHWIKSDKAVERYFASAVRADICSEHMVKTSCGDGAI